MPSRKDQLPQAHDQESCSSSIGSNNTLISTNSHINIYGNNTMLPTSHNRNIHASKQMHSNRYHHWLLNNGTPKAFIQSSSSLGSNHSNTTATTAISSSSTSANEYSNRNNKNNTESLVDTTQQMKYYMKRYLETKERNK